MDLTKIVDEIAKSASKILEENEVTIDMLYQVFQKVQGVIYANTVVRNIEKNTPADATTDVIVKIGDEKLIDSFSEQIHNSQ